MDLLIALVPGEDLLPILRACPAGRVKFLLAIPSGFGEASTEGKRRERDLVEVAKGRGMRLVGPNSLGMFNCALGLNASMVPELPRGGAGLSCATQSGGFGMALAMYARDHDVPVAKFCDLGNMADLDVTEVLEHYRDDSDTRVVGLFLEAIGLLGSRAEVLTTAAARKPIVAAHIGRTPDGGRASQAHIGVAPSTSSEAFAKLARSLILTQTAQELLHVSKALCCQPVPRGRRAAILTGSGGLGAELTDLAVENGLEVPHLSDPLQARLKALLPAYAACGNPVDLTPIWMEYPKLYPVLLRLLAASDEIDFIIVTIMDVATGISELIDALCALPHDQAIVAAGKPIYIYWNSPQADMANMVRLQRAHLPCYQSTLELVRVAALVARHPAAWRLREA